MFSAPQQSAKKRPNRFRQPLSHLLPEIFPTNVSSSVADGYPEHEQLPMRVAAILLLPARYAIAIHRFAI
ncbi:hypothetical protein [[Scytonema hofmanni] UTEX B 1581]|uniref:hypothetical protein n=1 Tax=[Scytonema hofmanni] UTEX B 1581 TaxID=379535 RepID=UPI000496F8A7|nr:hypothetical protein [[Scytonema hofmanni] UTEX B 1581]